jgi:hypothetical protein
MLHEDREDYITYLYNMLYVSYKSSHKDDVIQTCNSSIEIGLDKYKV